MPSPNLTWRTWSPAENDPFDTADESSGLEAVQARGGAVLECLGSGPVGVDVGLGHPLEPVQPLGLGRRDADQGGSTGHPVLKQCRAGQGMRPAAGTAEHRERSEVQVVGDDLHVRGGVTHSAVL